MQQAAEKQGVKPQDYVNTVSSKFRSLFDLCGIQYTHYARTSSIEHREVVENLWINLESSGGLYRTQYSGWYSIQEEAFVPKTQVQEQNGSHYSTETGQKLEWTEEDNDCELIFFERLIKEQNDMFIETLKRETKHFSKNIKNFR